MNIADRHDLGRFLNSCGLLGEGVEIGVDEGFFAAELLKTWKGAKLYGIDPYKDYSAEVWRDGPHFFPNRLEAYNRARALLAKFGERHELRLMTSMEAVKQFANDSLDFAYIDGNHAFDYVLKDIINWWDKIKPGGLIGGHDFYCRSSLYQLCEVPQAVGSFCQRMNLQEHITPCKSWWLQKKA